MLEPIWLIVFRMLIGTPEIPGSQSNPMILQWVKDLKAPAWYDNDDKPWCAVGLNRVFLTCQNILTYLGLLPAGMVMVAGTGYDLFRAKTFETWGVPLTVPALGCVMTFVRPEGGHVGLYLGERKDAYSILGANQSNTVGVAWIKKDRLTSTRWPANVPLPTSGRIWLNGSAEVSTNEG